jgi:hypothetical protein
MFWRLNKLVWDSTSSGMGGFHLSEPWPWPEHALLSCIQIHKNNKIKIRPQLYKQEVCTSTPPIPMHACQLMIGSMEQGFDPTTPWLQVESFSTLCNLGWESDMPGPGCLPVYKRAGPSFYTQSRGLRGLHKLCFCFSIALYLCPEEHCLHLLLYLIFAIQSCIHFFCVEKPK